MQPHLENLAEALQSHEELEVVWLYGSCARGDASETSDIDVAVAFRHPDPEPWERVDALRAELQTTQHRAVSVVDLNRAPTPLALNIIQDGVVLLCRTPLRLHAEQQRVWSLWEEYRGQHEHFRSAS